jgi:hypothetical protein
MKITLEQVQNNIADIANRHEYSEDIIYELLAAYGRSKSAITQLREGHLNKAESEGSVLQKDVVYFRTFPKGTQLELQVQELFEDPLTERYKPRYLIATNLRELAAKDTIKGTTLSIKLADIDNDLDFFYAWTGDEVVDPKTEAVADRRAADKMNELYIEIEKENRARFIGNPKFRHELNVFFTRLLFCFFAEDTGIYQEKQLTSAIKTFTQPDGSDLAWFFSELFKALDTKDNDKHSIRSPFKEFPYVNGSIFNTSKHSIAIPKFSPQARHLILECGRQNWGEINPDIFGTMFQGVVDPSHRDENGMDYTSVPNIMKVIKPLFLDELHELYVRHYDNENKLWTLFNRISAIKVFDPACGSGNFLIISYKSLRQLQHKIIARIDELKPAGLGIKIPSGNLLDVNQLYGIELDDFARELAILSIFLAKHQMNMEFNRQFGTSLAIIPLIELNTIVRDNAAQIDWQTVCPNDGRKITQTEQVKLFNMEGDQSELPLGTIVYDEIYLIGNPPYKGARKQSAGQKQDLKANFQNVTKRYKDLDYISIWFYKASQYIKGTSAKFSFVSVNSICQGDQVGMLWPLLINDELEINYAHTSFKWKNSAREVAGVTVVIVSLRNKSAYPKYLFTDNISHNVANINPYLAPSDRDTIVFGTRKNINEFMPQMPKGNMPYDGGNLILSAEEREDLVSHYPEAEKFIKRFINAKSFIGGELQYCLWIKDTELEEAQSIPEILRRTLEVKKMRLESSDPAAQKLASRSHQFREISEPTSKSLIIPSTSSENREYIPTAYLDNNTIASNAAFVIYDAPLWVFSLINSKMHMVWIRTVSGKLKTDYRYSSTLGYNTFPVYPLSQDQKDILNKSARRILLARAAHPEKTLADMYDRGKMPVELKEAHNENDHLVDKMYKKGGFKNDEERLSVLFDLYERMTIKEKTK